MCIVVLILASSKHTTLEYAHRRRKRVEKKVQRRRVGRARVVLQSNFFVALRHVARKSNTSSTNKQLVQDRRHYCLDLGPEMRFYRHPHMRIESDSNTQPEALGDNYFI